MGEVRWTDDRVDDAMEAIWREIMPMTEVREKVIRFEGKLDRTTELVEGLSAQLQDRETKREKELEDQGKERRTARRWAAGSGLTALGIILTAIGLLADKA